MPDYFVGQPLDNGNAFVLIKIAAIDTAGQERTIETTRPVVKTALLPQVVPESGDVVPGVENLFYLLTTDPRGTPIATTSAVTIGDDAVEVTSDERGIGTFSATPQADTTLSISVTSTDADGNVGSREFSFVPGESGAYVLLRTDSSVYQVGDLVSVNVICPDIQNAFNVAFGLLIVDKNTLTLQEIPVSNNIVPRQIRIFPGENLIFI